MLHIPSQVLWATAASQRVRIVLKAQTSCIILNIVLHINCYCRPLAAIEWTSTGTETHVHSKRYKAGWRMNQFTTPTYLVNLAGIFHFVSSLRHASQAAQSRRLPFLAPCFTADLSIRSPRLSKLRLHQSRDCSQNLSPWNTSSAKNLTTDSSFSKL